MAPETTHESRESRRGALYAVAAYTAWGVLPAYWKLLHAVAPLTVLAYRTVCSSVLLVALLAVTCRGGVGAALARARPHVGGLAVAAALIGGNWFVYIYAVTTGHVLDASLGYFINPLVNVALGVVVFHERLRRLQWIAVGLAGVGVALLVARTGHVPVLALLLALSFGLYGVARKRIKLDSLVASTAESLVLTVPGALLLAAELARGGGAAPGAGGSPVTLALLLGSGAVTAVPLLLFALAAQRMALSSLGFFQYLAPSLQFVLAVFVYREPVSPALLQGFAFIWVALAVYSVDAARRRPRP